MKLSILASLVLATVLSTVGLSASAATYALKKPLTNAGASDNARCTGEVCNIFSRALIDIQQAKNGSGASTPGVPGDTAAADLATAQWEVANLNWHARDTAKTVAYSHGYCNWTGTGVTVSCDSVVQIEAPMSPGFGYQAFNLRVTISIESPSASVCALSATLGATCSNGYASVTFNAGNPVGLEDRTMPGDTAHLLDPGVAP